MINEIINLINYKSLIKRFDIVLFDQSFFFTFERKLIEILHNFNN